jgi:hypothetical protein
VSPHHRELIAVGSRVPPSMNADHISCEALHKRHDPALREERIVMLSPSARRGRTSPTHRRHVPNDGRAVPSDA